MCPIKRTLWENLCRPPVEAGFESKKSAGQTKANADLFLYKTDIAWLYLLKTLQLI